MIRNPRKIMTGVIGFKGGGAPAKHKKKQLNFNSLFNKKRGNSIMSSSLQSSDCSSSSCDVSSRMTSEIAKFKGMNLN